MSFWVALRNRRDAHAGLVTSNHVRGEAWTYPRRRAGHGAAVGFLGSIERTTRVQVHAIDDAREGAALQWLRLHDGREYSFVDAMGFVLMRGLRIQEALAFDGDFAAAGFVEPCP
jgi:predicted nucleic acid-binding protein